MQAVFTAEPTSYADLGEAPTTPKGQMIQTKPETSPKPWPPQAATEVFTPAYTPQAPQYYPGNREGTGKDIAQRISSLTLSAAAVGFSQARDGTGQS